ncbi:lactadherin-like [Saccoglossus kowalevskii]
MDFILCLDQPGNECWKPNMNSTSDPDPWLKIELPAVTFVTHVETFGGIVDRVIKYKLGYSTDDEVYEYYKEMGQEKEIYANAYPMHIHKYELLSPIMARFVKIYPTEWENSICLAVELYGCLDGLIKPTCDDWLAGGFNNNWYWIGTMDNYTKDFCGIVYTLHHILTLTLKL